MIFARRGIDDAVKGRRDGLSGRSSEIDPREGIVMGGWGAVVVMGGGLETEVLDEDPLELTNFSASRLTLSQDSGTLLCCESPSPCRFSGITNNITLEYPFISSGFFDNSVLAF